MTDTTLAERAGWAIEALTKAGFAVYATLIGEQQAELVAAGKIIADLERTEKQLEWHNASLRAENEALRADANRYRKVIEFGWRPVPVEPTEEMRSSVPVEIIGAPNSPAIRRYRAREIWRYMLSASPLYALPETKESGR